MTFRLRSLLLCLLPTSGLAADGPPPFPREFRAAWVATVGNIDWPSRPGLSSDQQKAEATRILDRSAKMNINAIVLQVRPSADAFYESMLEPWSAFLTGTQGQRPEPYYDPLLFWVDEAHRRGLQLHAWFNPYRARYQGARYEDSSTHMSKTRPDLTKPYGGMLWLDPGEPEAADHTFKVLLDVVRRYDIDAVHFDDYFYPYPVKGPGGDEVDFPDGPGWDRYRASGGKLDRGDWRRENINGLIRRLAEGIKAERPGVLFGISPFGIPRPGKPKGVIGFDQYEKLYADSELWLREGWCDYFSPQLYWKIDAPGQPFRPLLNQWIAGNPKARHIWPGLSVSRVGSGGSGYAPEEILNQVAIIRETPGASGEVLFSMKALMDDARQIGNRLELGLYKSPALVPASPWLKVDPPALPLVSAARVAGGQEFTLKAGPGPKPFLWAVSARRGSAWSFSVHPGGMERVTLGGEGPSEVVVSAVGRTGDASGLVSVPIPGG